MNDNFVPTHLLLEMIFLLDKCKCNLCQQEKKKREEEVLIRK